MSWGNKRLIESLLARAQADGMDVLKEDRAYFDLCARCVPAHAHGWLIDRYVAAWVQAMQPIPEWLLAQQAGRYTANQWLMGIMKAKGFPLPTAKEIRDVKF